MADSGLLLPKPVLTLPEGKDNVLITNVQYMKSRKLDNGSYSDDKLYVVYRDFDTNKKNLQIISNPTTNYYTTKPEYRDDFKTQREFMNLDQVEMQESLYKNIHRDLFNMLKKDQRSQEDRDVKMVIERAQELGRWSAIKESNKWRHAYFSDTDILDYSYITANLHYKPQETILTKSYFDIETDILGRSRFDIDRGRAPIWAMTMIYDYDINLNKKCKPKVFTFLLRDHKRYPQQKKFEEQMDKFIDRVHEECDHKYGVADYHVMIFDDEAEMLYKMFQIQHLMKPDFTGIWNMPFDLLTLHKKAQYLGIPPEILFSHPDFKEAWCHYHLDERYKNDFKNRGDNFNCLSYTKYTDQMMGYAARRKGGKDYGSNGLDNIAKIELKEGKRKWDRSSTNTINSPIEEYFNAVLYNITDVWLLAGIERKTGDIDDQFYKGYDAGTRFDKANRQTVALKNLWSLGYFEQGYVMGNNINADYISEYGAQQAEVVIDEDDEEKLKGALVGNPLNLNRTGEKIFGDKRSDRLFSELLDLDAAAMYPNNKLKNNIARSTQYGRLIIRGKVSHLEYGLTPALRGGEFVDDYETQDWIKLGVKWFKLKNIEKYFNEFEDWSKKDRTLIYFKGKNTDVFFDLWSEKMLSIFSIMYPNKKKNLIKSYLKYVYNRDVKDAKATIYNNYDDIEYQTSLLSVIDWIAEVRPILTESGTFFKRHDETGLIPGLIILDNLLKQRKKLKRMALNYKQAGEMDLFRLFDLRQNRKKIFANSEYGVSGAPSAFNYNYHVAQSVTSKGQTLISNAMTLFEDLLTDTLQFYDMNELFHYCDNIITEASKYQDAIILNANKTVKEVLKRLKKKCDNIEKFNEDMVERYLGNVSQEGLNKIFYKNNINQFLSESDYVQKLLRKFVRQTSTFMNPEHPPKRTAGILKEFTNIVLEYCHYNYHYYGRIDRLINSPRNSVPIIDTDSNIITVKDLLDHIKTFVSEDSNRIKIVRKDSEERVTESNKLKLINIIATVLTEAISRSLQKFEEITNTTNTPLGTYAFKNEFYFTSLLVGEGKKRYLSNYKLQEGKYFPNGITDVKGFDFLKISAAPERLRKEIESIIFKHIVSDKVNIQKALKKFLKLEDSIRASLLEGDKELLNISKVNTMDAYADPFSIGQFKAAYIWNTIYPDKEIQFPAVVNLIKVDIASAKDIAVLAIEDKEYFDILVDLLKTHEMRTGITQIAVPLDQEVPEWLLKIMDVETMVQKYMNLVEPILDCLGIKSVYKTSTGRYISNIVDVG
jgi:DNA polymerase elongation subunit (family B)